MKHQRYTTGCRHPLTLLQDRMKSYFEILGYNVIDGPEIEVAWYHFDALNMRVDHSARSTDYTFYINKKSEMASHFDLVMRAHTSPMQVRAMLNCEPPLYAIGVGRVYRPDTFDRTHSPVFNQLEGLAVDTHLTISDLKHTLNKFAKAMLGGQVETRVRSYEFSYVNPGLEIDVQCVICLGQDQSCLTCSGEGWVEWGGCGMVHSDVLLNCGIDPKKYSAFSFGIGVERTLMLQSRVQDLRSILDGDLHYIHRAKKTTINKLHSTNVADLMVNEGFTETLSFPFIDPSVHDHLELSTHDFRRRLLTMSGSNSELGHSLRTSLLPTLLATLQHNISRGVMLPSIFELGRVFFPHNIANVEMQLPIGQRPSDEQLALLNNAIPHQPLQLAAVTIIDNWEDIVEVARRIFQFLGLSLHTRPAQKAPWVSGSCVELWCVDHLIGYSGQIRTSVQIALQLLPNDTSDTKLNFITAMEIDFSLLRKSTGSNVSV